jgi:hypothetical protein
VIFSLALSPVVLAPGFVFCQAHTVLILGLEVVSNGSPGYAMVPHLTRPANASSRSFASVGVSWLLGFSTVVVITCAA